MKRRAANLLLGLSLLLCLALLWYRASGRQYLHAPLGTTYSGTMGEAEAVAEEENLRSGGVALGCRLLFSMREADPLTFRWVVDRTLTVPVLYPLLLTAALPLAWVLRRPRRNGSQPLNPA